MNASGDSVVPPHPHAQVHKLSMLLKATTDENSRLRRENMLLRSRLALRSGSEQIGSPSRFSVSNGVGSPDSPTAARQYRTLTQEGLTLKEQSRLDPVEAALEEALQVARHRAAEKHLVSSQAVNSLYRATLAAQEQSYRQEQVCALEALEEANATSLWLEKSNEELQAHCAEQHEALHVLMQTLRERNLYIDELEAIVRILRREHSRQRVSSPDT